MVAEAARERSRSPRRDGAAQEGVEQGDAFAQMQRLFAGLTDAQKAALLGGGNGAGGEPDAAGVIAAVNAAGGPNGPPGPAGGQPGVAEVVNNDQQPWLAVDVWLADFQAFCTNREYDTAAQIGVISANDRRAAFEMKQSMQTNVRALHDAADYGKFKMYRILKGYRCHQKLYSEGLLQAHQTHNILASHILCVNAGYNWSAAQNNLLTNILLRWGVPMPEYEVFVQRNRAPAYERQTQELEVLA
eukprot:g19511.t1